MNQRHDRLVTAARTHGFDAVAVVPGANLRYLTGLDMHTSERLTVALFGADGRAAIVLPALEAPRAKAQQRGDMAFYPWADGEGYRPALAAALADMGVRGQVGVEYTAMRVLELRAIEEAAPAVTTADATPLFAELRSAKDADELAAMRKAVQIIETALGTAIDAIRIGMTERQLAQIWNDAIRAQGSTPSFETIVASGPNSANPHHSNTDRPFAEGDLIILDGGAWYDGYASDITRTVAVGAAGEETRRIYEAVLAANKAGRAACAPGVTGETIDRAARREIEERGFGPQFVHRTGHGLGMEIHEPPYIVSGSTGELPVGATFTIEPGVYVSGVGGVRIEDDMIITERGAESLTSFERCLIVVEG